MRLAYAILNLEIESLPRIELNDLPQVYATSNQFPQFPHQIGSYANKTTTSCQTLYRKSQGCLDGNVIVQPIVVYIGGAVFRVIG
jgi:hypothetical protein